MSDWSLILDLIDGTEEAIRRIERRFQGVETPEDFISGDEGLDRLDAIAMMLIAIGENMKKIDKATGGELLGKFPEIHWTGVKGTRDILAHDYFGIDHEEIYNICSFEIAPLKDALQRMRGIR